MSRAALRGINKARRAKASERLTHVIEGLNAGESQTEIARRLGVSVKTINRDAMKVDALDAELRETNLEVIKQHRDEIRREILKLKELVYDSPQLDDLTTVQAIIAANKQLIDLLGLDRLPAEAVPYNFDVAVNFGPENCPHCGMPLDAPKVIPPAEARMLPLPISGEKEPEKDINQIVADARANLGR